MTMAIMQELHLALQSEIGLVRLNILTILCR